MENPSGTLIQEREDGLRFHMPGARTQTCEQRFEPGTRFALLDFHVPGWPVAHSHEYYEIMYVERGEGKHIINQDIYDIAPGSVFLMQPGLPHKIIMRPTADIHFMNIELLPSLVSSLASGGQVVFGWHEVKFPERIGQGRIVSGMRCLGMAANEVCSSLTEVFMEARARRAHWDRMIPVQIQVVIGLLARARAERNLESLFRVQAPDSLLQALMYIDRHFTEEIDVDDICRETGLSRSSLARQFRKYLGLSVIDYLQDIRITKGMVLMWRGETVSDAAYECGFSDPGYFGRAFRKRVGVSPAQFREMQPEYTSLYSF